MPKISRHGGPSNAADKVAGEDVAQAVPATGEEESSPGSSSQTSTQRPSATPEPSGAPRRRRVPKTESRSKTAPTGASTAPMTGGGQTEPTSGKGSEDA